MPLADAFFDVRMFGEFSGTLRPGINELDTIWNFY
jgi:hypothetical protein